MEAERKFLPINYSCPDCPTYNECMLADDERAFSPGGVLLCI